MINLENFLKNSKNCIRFEEGPNLSYKIIAPFFHEDGDIIETYLIEDEDGYKITDFGLTLMKLSYYFDLDTDSKVEVFNNILKYNKVNNFEGIISTKTNEESFLEDLSRFCLAISKITNMEILTKSLVTSMFNELLDNYFDDVIKKKYKFERDFKPFKDSFITVQYKIEVEGLKTPLYVFPIRSSMNALRMACDCNELKPKLTSLNIAVCEDFSKIDKNDFTRMSTIADKVYTNLDLFMNNLDEQVEKYKKIIAG